MPCFKLDFSWGAFKSGLQRLLRRCKYNSKNWLQLVSQHFAISQVQRLLYRAKQRGFLELDLLVGSWAESHVPQMDAAALQAFQEVLVQENPDMFKWLTGQAPAPPEMHHNAVFKVSTLRAQPQPDRPAKSMV